MYGSYVKKREGNKNRDKKSTVSFKNFLFPTCCSQDFGLFYLNLWSPFLPKSALQGELPESLTQILLLLLFLCPITALAEEARRQNYVAFFPGKFGRCQTKLQKMAVYG